MNKKIKMIELLNKIANGEEPPKKIKVKDYVFIWKSGGIGYSNVKEDVGYSWLDDYISLDSAEDLNDEVEILEDNTEDNTEEINIQEIEEIDEYLYQGSDLPNVKDGHCVKTNELIRAIKQLDRTVNKLRKEKE